MAGMFDSTTFGGMTPYLAAALAALSGGFQGAANAQRVGARGFAAGLAPGFVGGMAGEQNTLQFAQEQRNARARQQAIQTQNMAALDQINRWRTFNRQPPLTAQDVASGNWNPTPGGQQPAAAAAPAPAAAMGAAPASGAAPAGAGAVTPPQLGAPGTAGGTSAWQQNLAEANRAMQAGLPDVASSYFRAVELDPGYKAAVAVNMVAPEVQKAVAISNATLSNDIAKAQAGRAYINTPTQIINQQESAAASTIGAGIGKVYNTLQESGLKSSGQAANWQRLGSILGQIKTGKYAGTVNDFAKSLQAFGFDPASLGITNSTALVDAATAASNQLTLQLRNPSGGAGMPGAMSDPDRLFLQQATANIGTSQAAIPLMIKWQTKLAQRDAEIAKVARDYKNSALPGKPKGVIDDGVYDAIAQYGATHPLFTEQDRAEIQKLGIPSSPQSGAGNRPPPPAGFIPVP